MVDTSERRRNALGRLVAHENSASDLLALLFEMDPEPLSGVLGFDTGTYTCQREVQTGAGKGRLDLVLRRQPDSHPVAVLEMKGASDVHGDQLDRYNAWADGFTPAPRRFYCSLDAELSAPDASWQALSLIEVFGAWKTSSDPHAVWLAGEIADVLRTWDAEADDVMGKVTGWYVPDLVSRRTASAVDVQLRAFGDGSMAGAYRTSGGNPMFMAWRRHPHGSDDAWVAVDVRCEGRGAASSWLVRPCVDVVGDGQSALLEAHDLAVQLQPAMVLSAVRMALIDQGRNRLAAALSADENDGLARRPTPEILAAWRARLAAGEKPRRRHPVFFHDRGLRLATQLRADATELTRNDLAQLTVSVLDHLVARAR
ncbi:PDDEXK-like family protein [Actinoplanes sichuanensis]|uniref:PD-(D/E)XK nuclease superfamily protein n=1 Tax=Actinoplanes sichuanensis TaxID=512349 RepID=A0ABW4A1Q5_9ACTN